MVSLDLRDYASLKQMLQTVQPDAVIHTAAQARPHICQAEPQSTFAINVEASLNLAGLCADKQISLLFVSTDLVFDGLHPPYAESDPVSPINIYGEQKVAAEQGMVERYPRTMVGRMPLMYGVVPHAPSFLQPLVQNLQKGQSLQLFQDEFRTPVSGTDAAQGLLLMLEQDKRCLHLGGPEHLSRYQIGQHLVKILGFSDERLTGCLQADTALSTPRPADVSLDSSQAYALGFAPHLLTQELERLFSGSNLPT